MIQERRLVRERFSHTRLVENQYRRALVSVAEQVDSFIKGMPVSLRDLPRLHEVMRQYSDALRPWALSITQKMHLDISNRDLKAWTDLGRSVGHELRPRLLHTDIVLRNLLSEQVDLITGLPLEAYNRVSGYTQRMFSEGTDYTDEILRTGSVIMGRSNFLAITSARRASSLITETRAESVGSTSYIWRTRLDTNVRQLHRELEGQVILWGSPPVSGDKGQRAHAGAIYLCRCWPEPILPDVIGGHYAIARGIEQRSYQ
jgi:hypothetical protein